MAIVTPQIKDFMQTQSWIRRMFEAAAELKAKYGEDRVFDFSLGNPDVPPPAEVAQALHDLAQRASKPLSFGYCPNAGLPAVREALAGRVSEEQQTPLAGKHIVVTCGAAGAMNVLFRAILLPGDEVMTFSPYFVEYGFYAANFGARLVTVPSRNDFSLDPKALEAAITDKTRALILNSPNNPTGVIYSREELEAVVEILTLKSAEYGRPILLISDEPYRFLTYDGLTPPAILPLYDSSIIISSFSKSLSLAGERIGYLAVNPRLDGADLLLNGIILANRILGYVNAPIIGQQIILAALHAGVDVTVYERRRRAMAEILDEMGLEYVMPQGAFYFFPKTPQGYSDDEFIKLLLSENIIAVPGSGFGREGHFRVAFCMEESIIRASRSAWLRVKNKPASTPQ
ncbi:MAG: pyridoxal phosphate-dependent aminotransferase [candidate division KSB1 bacterium]|nr:pyridoxal phosphate-dependent aminotransferase [candidate division KSB1 bacterium]